MRLFLAVVLFLVGLYAIPPLSATLERSPLGRAFHWAAAYTLIGLFFALCIAVTVAAALWLRGILGLFLLAL